MHLRQTTRNRWTPHLRVSVRISRQIIRTPASGLSEQNRGEQRQLEGNPCCLLRPEKAFDKVDHSILVAKLQALGVSDRLLIIIESYLHNRRQFVQIDDAESSERKVTSGVPQGSRSGPLFLVYVNDLPEAIIDLFVSVFLMADDSKRSASGASLQRSLANLENWSLANKMKLNPSKTKIVIFSGLQPEYKLCNE